MGKTHVAQAIGHVACHQGRSVLFDKTARERDEDERLALRRAGPARNDFAPESLSTFAEMRRLRQ